MIDLLKQLFRTDQDDTAPTPGSHDLALAATALMVQLSRVDSHEDEEELETIVRCAGTTLGVSPDEARELLEDARAQAEDAVSLYEFTGLLNESLDQQGKLEILEDIWRVAYADGRIDKYEEHLIRRMAELLHLNHREYMQCRHRAEAARPAD